MRGHKQLAASVIGQAISDFMHPKCRDKQTCYDFLVGRTPIARFWFEMAEEVPMRGTMDKLYWKLRDNPAVKSKMKEVKNYDHSGR